MTTEIVDILSFPSEAHRVNAPVRLRKVEKVSYGLGDVACNMSWNLVGSFLLYFYTNVALVPVAALGTLFLFSRILDAVIDPVVGATMDRTRTRFGRARPYILFASVPFGLLSVLTFWMPHLPDLGKIVYAYATFIVLGIVYSVINVPYGALMPMMTRDTNQKSQLGSLRAFGSSIGTIIVTALTMPLVKAVGGHNEAKGFLLTSVVFAVISTTLMLIVYRNCKERYTDSPALIHTKLIPSVGKMLRNEAWLTTFGVGMCTFIRLGLTISVTIYFCLNVIHKPWAISVLLPMISGAMLVSAVASPILFKRFGKRASSIVALLMAVACYLVLPFLQTQMTPFIVVYALANIAAGVSTTAIYTMVADSVDLHEWKFNIRNEGLLFSGFSIATKVGMALGSAFIAYALAWVGFKPAAPNASALHLITVLYYAGPITLMLAQCVCMAFYTMDKRHPGIVADLDARLASRPADDA
jgi:GPH family glycoside/pentoside/hexuronide:cation symporter